jgi:glutaminase
LSGSAPPASDKSFADQRSREIPIALESPVLSLLREMHTKYLAMRDGAVAEYIPELARVAPDQFGIALATVDGHVYEVGDASSPFTIQSISKPLVYGLALRDRGRDAVLAKGSRLPI